MYRVLEERGAVQERRAQLSHPHHARPELVATAANSAWSWDITKLRMTVKWSYLYLYVLLDLFSRYVVGWMIARQENAALAKLLIEESVAKHEVKPGTLVLHSDRGAPMISKTLAQLLADLEVARSFSRPHTSNDNPFSESAFKAAKYHPSYPGRFATLDEALAWGRQFFGWYNHEHRHSGIAFLAPADVYYGRAEERLVHRHAVLQAAYLERPERFPHGPPKRQVLPAATYINPPSAIAQPVSSAPGIIALAPAETQQMFVAGVSNLLTGSAFYSRLFPSRSPPCLLDTAEGGGLKPPSERRLRGAYPHLRHSIVNRHRSTFVAHSAATGCYAPRRFVQYSPTSRRATR